MTVPWMMFSRCKTKSRLRLSAHFPCNSLPMRSIVDIAAVKTLHEQGALFVYTVDLYGYWTEGRIPGSIQLQRMSNATLRQLITGRTKVVFYGRGDGVNTDLSAARATAKATKQGFKNVVFSAVPKRAWRAEGYAADEGANEWPCLECNTIAGYFANRFLLTNNFTCAWPASTRLGCPVSCQRNCET